MPIDERDYHSYHLPERVKERRLQAMRQRFARATPRKRVNPFKVFAITTWLLAALAFAGLALKYMSR
ncbi:hypothetical protein [Propionivibrio soli]|uniref:hypothetical protein n=1 Tax=Propionivibrio soli TaxID=2976531 RepID=UPI0021E8E4D9|nr:hypothetical protein [Propionivibrio soli]